MADQEAAEVPVISSRSIAGQSRLWNTCEKRDTPYMVVLKYGKYGRFKYDMFTIDRRLNEEAVKRIEELSKAFFRSNVSDFRENTGFWGAGPASGRFPTLELSKAIELAEEIASIVKDPKNHKPLGGEPP